MSTLLRSVLILLLALLPLRGWAQASMAADDWAMHSTAVLAQHAAVVHGMEAGDMAAMDMTAAQSIPPCHDQAASDHTAHDHQHCVICQLAVAQPPALAPLAAHAAQHPCPAAADTAWHSEELQALQRPPRA